MIKFGGEWHVVKLGDKFTSVHKHYLKTHNIKSIKKIKDDYAAPIKWYRLPIVWLFNLLANIIEGLTRWLATKK